MRIDIRFHEPDEGKLDLIEILLHEIIERLKNMSKELDDLQVAVAAEDTVIDSAITLLQGLSAQIIALKDDPAKLVALANEVTGKTQALSAAVAANTPSA